MIILIEDCILMAR